MEQAESSSNSPRVFTREKWFVQLGMAARGIACCSKCGTSGRIVMQAPAFELPKRCAHLGKVALRHVCAFSPKRSLPLQPALHFTALPDRNPNPRATWPLSRLKSSYKNGLRSLQLSSHQPEKSPHRGASMKKTASVFLLAAMLLSLEQAQANDKRGAVPSKVLSAKTIYVDNQTNDAELQ